jgi:hypothetical protein
LQYSVPYSKLPDLAYEDWLCRGIILEYRIWNSVRGGSLIKSAVTHSSLLSSILLLSPAKPSTGHNIEMVTGECGDVYRAPFMASHVQN